MKISGLMKTTLLDFPGTLACTVFTGGCNFRCPFCYNSELITSGADTFMSEEEFFAFLNKRAHTLEGVVVSGGEPTLQKDLPLFIAKIKREYKLKVKLDTNGSRPEVLKGLIDDGLLDYVAMDIKAGPSKYRRLAGLGAGGDFTGPGADEFKGSRGASPDITGGPRAAEDPVISVAKSKDTLISTLPASAYEFRTTVVGGLHAKGDFEEIGRFIQGAGRYFLQRYQDNEHVLNRNGGFYPPEIEDMKAYMETVRPYVGSVELRGVETD